MREIGAVWFQVFDDLEGFFEAEVRRVGTDADAIEHKNVEIAKSVHRRRRNNFQIGRISEIVKAIGDYGQLAVNHLNRRDLDVAYAKWSVWLDRVRDKLRQSAA